MINSKSTSKSGRLLNQAQRVIWGIVWVISGVGAGVLAVMMLIVVVDVSLRSLINQPIIGAYEGVEFMMVILTYCAMAYTATKKGHIIINLTSSWFPQRIQVINNIISHFICVAFWCLIAWQGVIQAQHVQSLHIKGYISNIPVSPFLYVLAFGSILIGLVYLTYFLESVRECLKK